jgi:hypothetical protein
VSLNNFKKERQQKKYLISEKVKEGYNSEEKAKLKKND